ncbi:exopolysaccharide biosynthesis protein [Candidatus Acetothermia bacterium]|nr:exopolysaccharide biosynthesis protein [Candidatus Acetothermia bacterium]MCI2427070.1 exopolysaccharide biosynthesis protein [Candidatus Acetothermia bacterium]MCI2428337.1 exopolysaccharide biosynthesis protein [Candidatus Acetothermia bacterium]
MIDERLSVWLASLPDALSLKELLLLAREKGFGILFSLLALPAALPIPAAGFATPFGFAIVLLSFQFIIARPQPWLPRFILRRSLSSPLVKGMKEKGGPLIHRIEKVMQPRMSLFFTPLGRILSGVMILLMGTLMMIPIPLTNTVPAAVVFLIGIGLLLKDGLVLAGGVLAGLGAIAFYVLILLGGWKIIA